MYGYMMADRTMFQPNEVLHFKALALNEGQVILELMNVSAFGVLVWINRLKLMERKGVLVALGGMLVMYVAVIVVGRNNEMGGLTQAVRINSYYLYLFWCMVVMIAYFMLSKEINSSIAKLFGAIFVITSLLLGVCQAQKIYVLSSGYGRINNNVMVLVTTLDLLVQEKGQEPSFSFYVDPHYPGNSIYSDVHQRRDPTNKKYSFAELVYPQYFRRSKLAKYQLTLRDLNWAFNRVDSKLH